MNIKRNAIAAMLLVGLGLSGTAAAQDSWPSRTVTLVVPFAPGGSNDVVGRAIADGLTAETGTSFVVENLPSAGGIVGMQKIDGAKPDGYTLGIGSSSSFGTSPVVNTKLPYDVEKDFTQITELAAVPMVIVATPSFEASNFQQFVDLVRANPGKYAYASGGIGTLGHFGMEYLLNKMGMQMLHVPYKGAGQAKIDVVAGQVPVLIENFASSVQHIREGQVKPLVIAFENRINMFPDVPIVTEFEELKDFQLEGWMSLIGPGDMDPALQEKIRAAAAKALERPEIRQRLEAIGYYIRTSTPEELSARISTDLKRWRDVVKNANLTFN
ncbi:Bug family tripartite tricarboxylate transporter substrate binding protein [Pseudochelatococcus lubricantis]|uniref:Bug family tripartite tricarboxylate transporter substrate binding protein n=1 Tax=Pseudochelatococcus lubricantis TaxID=1538102 RepID=UPI0035E79CB6